MDRLHFKDMMIVNKCLLRLLLCFPYNTEQAIEHEISLSNNTTLGESEFIWTFFINYDLWMLH